MKYNLDTLLSYTPRIVALLLVLNIFGLDIIGNHTVFLLDYVPTPIRARDWGYYLVHPGIRILHNGLLYVLGYIWGSKLYLISIVVVTLILGYRRGQRINMQIKSDSRIIPILGMIIMVFNPVFSSRMGTQPGVRFGIVFLGWGLYWLICHRDTLTTKHSIIIGLFRGIAMMSMNHASFMILVSLIILVAVKRYWRSLRSAMVIGGVVGLLNLNWIVGGLIGANQVIQGATTFSQQNIEEFMTFSHSGLGPVITSVLGYGFWGERYGSAFAPTWTNPRWRVAGVLLLGLVCYGRLMLYRTHRQQAWFVIMLAGVAVILGVGVASHPLAPLIQRLYDHVPGYRGLREPHKWIGLYMMIIIPLMMYGYVSLAPKIKSYLSLVWYSLCVIALLIAWSPGSGHQLMMRYDMTDYPQSYSQTRDYLITQGGSGYWLQLPRHSYHRCQWTNKVIANSFGTYMKPASVIISDNIEIGQLYSNSSDPRSRSIEEFIKDHDLSHLSGYDIQGIIYLSQCADFNNYEWITTHTGLSLSADFGDVKVYRVKGGER